jgi:hypothetical protein
MSPIRERHTLRRLSASASTELAYRARTPRHRGCQQPRTMPAIWHVAMHDRSRMPELQPDLETETVHAVERMTMHAAEVTLFGNSGWVPAAAGYAWQRAWHGDLTRSLVTGRW